MCHLFPRQHCRSQCSGLFVDLSQSFNILEHGHLPRCGDDLYDQEFFDYGPQLVSCLLMLVSEERQPWRSGDPLSSFDSPCGETEDRSAFFFFSHVFDSPCGETKDRSAIVVMCSIVLVGRRKTEVLFIVVMCSIVLVGRRKTEALL